MTEQSERGDGAVRRLVTARATVGFFACAAVLASAGGCGGGSSNDGATTPVSTTPPSTPVATTTIDYPNSVALGLAASEDLVYQPAANASSLASVRATTASTLLAVGANAIVAEHVDATLPGQRIVCVSGNGQSTNVVTGINLGVTTESAAVLLDVSWTSIDAPSAWAVAVARGGTFAGWENCGVKPEGAASPSSQLRPRADGGYAEDVYDGNPGTTYNVVSRTVAPSVVAAMLSTGGYATVEDPARPLVLTLRAYGNTAGNTIFVERGEPAVGAPAGTRGFIALYLRSS